METWITAGIAIIQAIAECRKAGVPDQQILANIRRPSLLQGLRFERRLRLIARLSPDQWKDVRESVLAELKTAANLATDEDLVNLIQHADED